VHVQTPFVETSHALDMTDNSIKTIKFPTSYFGLLLRFQGLSTRYICLRLEISRLIRTKLAS
jgi:hypothetical protein